MKSRSANGRPVRREKGEFSNTEVVTLALYLLGGDSRPIDTEDVAIKANELAPGRFAWVKYPEQINIHTIKTHLWDSKSVRRGSLVAGSEKEGWTLTQDGVALARARARQMQDRSLAKRQVSHQDKKWIRTERQRLLASEAFRTYHAEGLDAVSTPQTEAFFRINDYVIGDARQRKVNRIVTAFGEDRELGRAVRALAERVQSR